MKIEYFIDKDFKNLHQKYNELKMKNKSHCVQKGNIIQNTELNSTEIEKDLKLKKKELVTLKDYENYYLLDGYFVYPYSLPWHEYPIDEYPPKIPEGELQFVKKYEKEIEIGRKIHFMENIDDT